MNFNISHKRLYRSLLNMIEWTIQHQERCGGSRKYISTCGVRSWAKEFATIKFALPRQSGHTTFAVKLLSEYFKNAALIIPPTIDYRRHVFFKTLEPSLKSRISSPSFLEHWRGQDFDAVIIDCSSFLSRGDKEKIYSFFEPLIAKNPNFCFLFLE